MQRPKRLANRVVEQWEQNLLLKVMQRKIKCAKSTIGAMQGTKKSQSQVSLAQKPRECLELCEEWNFSDAEQEDEALAKHLISHFDHASKPKVEDIHEENGVHLDGSYCDPTTSDSQGEENINPQLGFHHDEQELPNETDDFMALTARFHENFKDCDDDLLSQIWRSCKRDNTLFDNITGLNQTRRVGGAIALHTADFDPSPIPMAKLASLKDRRIPKTVTPHPKKNMVRDQAAVSKFMKKRESGWRE